MCSRHNGVHCFISHLASWLRTRRFGEVTFRPSGATNHWKKHSEARLSYLSAHLHLVCSDFLHLSSSHFLTSPLWLFPPLLFHLCILKYIYKYIYIYLYVNKPCLSIHPIYKHIDIYTHMCVYSVLQVCNATTLSWVPHHIFWRLPIYLSIYLSIHLSIDPSICPCLSLSLSPLSLSLYI